MIYWIFDQPIEIMKEKNIDIDKANVLVLGQPSENVDTRNSKVLELLSKFAKKNKIWCLWPVVKESDFYENYNFNLIESLKTNKKYTVVMLVTFRILYFKEKSMAKSLNEDGFFMILKE